MARPSLAELKKLIKEKEQKSKGNFTAGEIYPFWSIKDAEEAVVRLLPDQDEENPLAFYVESFEHKIHINGNMETIPCLSNYGEECPICERSLKYYKIARENKEETKDLNNLGPNAKKGSYYYKKRNALAKAYIVKDPLPEIPDTGKNFQGEIKTLKMSSQVLKALNDSLAGFGDDDNAPWELVDGFDFIIRKGKQGTQASYTGSSFARKPSSLPDSVLEVLELTDLKTLMPKNPGIENVAAKLEAHDNGTDVPDDNDAPKEKSSSKASSSSSSAKEKSSSDDEPAPEKKEEKAAKEPTPAASNDGDDDILAKIRNRNKAKK
jgi:hypothetical protein